MLRLDHKNSSLTLITCLLISCNQETNLDQRRNISTSTQNAQFESDGSFTPEDPNFSNTASNFPDLSFKLESEPQKTSDRNVFSFPVDADPAISHYAFKVDSTNTCSQPGGYTVIEATQDAKVETYSLETGDVFLCILAYHFPTKSWQSLEEASVYSWTKIEFQRTIDSYFEFIDGDCGKKRRINAQIDIQGDSGTYRWRMVDEVGCFNDPSTYIDLISQVKVEDQSMSGLWHEAEVVAGWFKFNFENQDRTSFRGSWGYGKPGEKVEGVWNSSDL